MPVKQVACARCRTVITEYYDAPCGDRFCEDCHQFTNALEQALVLKPAQQQELIAELNKDRFIKAKR